MSALAALALLGGATAAIQPPAIAVRVGAYAPRDECGRVPGAAAFRAALERAVRARDAAALLALADPAVKLDFGEGAGTRELRARLAREGELHLWAELAAILPLGCAVNAEGALVMPWIFAQDIPDADAFETLLVIGADVPLRTVADAGAKPAMLLSWLPVSIEGGFTPDERFQRVRLPDGGATGYVESAKLRSLVDYRLLAERKGGAWRITAFIAGD